jgi:hypothetical protein
MSGSGANGRLCIAGTVAGVNFSTRTNTCGGFSGDRVNRSLTVFLNLRATNQIYICQHIGAGEPREASTGALDAAIDFCILER